MRWYQTTKRMRIPTDQAVFEMSLYFVRRRTWRQVSQKSFHLMSEANYLLGMQLYSNVNAQANLTEGGKPNPEPSPAKSRRRRYPLQDITAIIYPGQVNTHIGGGYGSNPPTPISYSGNPPYQRGSLRLHVAKYKTSVLFPKKQPDINAKVKKQPGTSGLDIQDRTEKSVHDCISAEPGKDKVKKILKDKAASSPRRQLRRGKTYLKLRKLKAKGYFTV